MVNIDFLLVVDSVSILGRDVVGREEKKKIKALLLFKLCFVFVFKERVNRSASLLCVACFFQCCLYIESVNGRSVLMMQAAVGLSGRPASQAVWYRRPYCGEGSTS